jgi:predicted lipoprotein with Yx(FWY)xxD motif
MATGSPIVTVATDPKVGPHLVGPNGQTLYLFDDDQGTRSACTGGWAAIWPTLSAPGTPSVGAGVDQTKLTTASGQAPSQVVYNGHLLYYFTTSAATRTPVTKGITIPHWDPIAPSGAKVETGN